MVIASWMFLCVGCLVRCSMVFLGCLGRLCLVFGGMMSCLIVRVMLLMFGFYVIWCSIDFRLLVVGRFFCLIVIRCFGLVLVVCIVLGLSWLCSEGLCLRMVVVCMSVNRCGGWFYLVLVMWCLVSSRVCVREFMCRLF